MDETSISIEQLELLLEENNLLLSEVAPDVAQSVDLLTQIYAAQLFVIGVAAAVMVCVILYKFLRSFY